MCVWKMAGVSDCFTIGSIVSCKTCHSQDVEGEVMAFDPQSKMLILKCPASNGRSSINDVYFVNLSLVSNVTVVSEVTTPAPPPQSLNIEKISRRLRNQLEEKRRQVTASNAGVSPEGQKLFMAISKTVPEVIWRGEDIVVYNNVVINPPYKAENLRGDADDGRAVLHIRKIIEKHIKDSVCQGGSN